MKTKVFMTAALAALTFVGCSKEEYTGGIDNGQTQSIHLQIASTANTRSDEASAHGQAAKLLSAMIYFVDDSADPVVFDVRKIGNAADADATMAELSVGKEFDNVPASVKKVYVVGNYNSSDEAGNTAALPTRLGIGLSQVKATMLDIEQAAYPKTADGTTDTRILTVLDGIAPVVPYSTNPGGWNGTGTPQDGDSYANIRISPVNARIEIKEVEYDGQELASFELEGIYINNYLSKLPLSLDASSASATNHGSDKDKFDKTNNSFGYTDYSVLYDTVEESFTGPASALPANGTWAYHVFGNSPSTHIVLKLTDVVDINNNQLGVRFVTVKGFKDENGDVTNLTRATLYRIAKIKFDDTHIELVPEPESISLWVNVEVEPWNTVDVTPNL